MSKSNLPAPARGVERRAFLAAPAAPAAGALLPSVSVLPPATPAATGVAAQMTVDAGSPTRYWVEVVTLANGTTCDGLIYPTKKQFSDSTQKTEQRSFVPLGRERRFLLGYDDYCYIAEEGLSHALSVPRDIEHAGNEFYDTDGSDWLTREQGLAAVANYNLGELESNCERVRWAVLVEVGEPTTALNGFMLAKNGVGDLNMGQDFPVRIVRPTQEEIDRFAAV